ncbi:MAG: DUF354 domain-containing protein [Flavobacteriaceae bacterium]
MKILFDINHPVDINFFKNSIILLRKEGHHIHIIYRDRGKIEKILKYELGDFEITKIGEHKMGFLKKIVYQLLRDFQIGPFIKKNEIDLVVCFGSTAAIGTWLVKRPYLAFDDDFEYKIPFYHANWFSTKHIYPDLIEFENSKTVKYKGFKELAYLHPNYLKTSYNILDKYTIKPNSYVFIREIANVSLNYQDSNSILNKVIKKIKDKGLDIVLSLEDKSKTDQYASDCIILQEPVADIYSLMRYALFAISSGDTVARETSLLGVPTIYTGGRYMAVNQPLLEEGLMYESVDPKGILEIMDTFSLEKKEKLSKHLESILEARWEDTTKLILDQVHEFVK